MNIGGFHPASFNDFPGRVAAVIFTQGCNFRCPWCHNAELIPAAAPAGADLYAPEEILARLAARRNKLGGAVISGGEPTLQPDLLDFCREIKKLGLAVKVDSNGSRPEILAKLLAAKVVDFLAMDIKAPPAKYEQLVSTKVDLEAIRRSIALIAASGLAHQFRTTMVDHLLTAADLDEIRRLLPAASPHKTQPYRPSQPAEQEG
ncbi:anaerobic ribonucleoside-triphosphate reductase activating protein [Desulfurivibrio alkaliphilus]|uniref:Anaerobic ribonucleoside-triphosphate reductase activating protein n=1 Tax=Desulfurivibrio alkaliphilus (strain DSM 19089 / UNIQEM U267 / AHT2) TaxID=589865 RepID=D6Z3Y2_DESAT|nr:anaerobic ribonucleoside-triphosphate reductase activating protein [Desulfurivibrio alkaliphilus]ADH86257.1 anaerobic ribonucleoside-triphosphate reductase activating protein [Desulfurivibrio alkaliphilus AHT 2]